MNLRTLVRSNTLLSHAVQHLQTVRMRRKYPEGIAPERPLRVVVEPTNACNLQCTFCGNKSMKRKRSMLEMSIYERLIEQMEELGIQRLTLHTIGEPTLHAELPTMIRLAKAAGISVGFSTNGTTLDEAMVRALVEAGPDMINLSVEAANPAKIRQLRKGLDPELFLAGMKRLRSFRDEHGPLVESPWGLVRMPTLVGTCVITNLLDRAEEHAWFERYAEFLDDIEFHEPITQMGAVGETAHLKHGFIPRKLKSILYGSLRFTCPSPWGSLYLLANGDVSSCHFDFESRLKIGRFPESSLQEIWKGTRLASLRKAHMDFDFSEWKACAECDGTFYGNRFRDREYSRRVKERNGYVATRDMWSCT